MGTSSGQPTATPAPNRNLVPSMAAPRPMPVTKLAPEVAPAAPAAPNVFQQSAGSVTQAGDIFGRLGNFQAPQMSGGSVGRGSPVRGIGAVGGDIQSGQLSSTDMGTYMNPYTQNVIERGEMDIARQREQALNSLAAQAQAARAFGGSRHGIAEGTTYGEYGRMAADLAAQQRQAAFLNAQQAAQFDIGQDFASQQARQAALEAGAQREQQAGIAGGQQATQRAIANAQAKTAQMQANLQAQLQAAGIQQQAGQNLASLGAQQFGMGQSAQQAIGQQAAFQRGLDQQMLDLAQQQYQGTVGAPLAGLGAMSQVLGTTPYGTSTTDSTPFNPATLLYAMV